MGRTGEFLITNAKAKLFRKLSAAKTNETITENEEAILNLLLEDKQLNEYAFNKEKISNALNELEEINKSTFKRGK